LKKTKYTTFNNRFKKFNFLTFFVLPKKKLNEVNPFRPIVGLIFVTYNTFKKLYY
jgi:hypothetical protein